MKKLTICAALVSGLIALCSFGSNFLTGYRLLESNDTNDLYWVSAADADNIISSLQNSEADPDPDVTLYDYSDTQKTYPLAGKVCPGTGTLCWIKLPKDDDGDPVWIVSYKGRGRANVEIVY